MSEWHQVQLHEAVPGKARPRLGRGVVHMPRRYQAWRRRTEGALRRWWGDRPPLDGPVTVEVVMRYERPRSRVGQLWAHTARVDVDNGVGSVLDALQRAGVITDDRRVVRLSAVKQWAEEAGATVRVRPM